MLYYQIEKMGAAYSVCLSRYNSHQCLTLCQFTGDCSSFDVGKTWEIYAVEAAVVMVGFKRCIIAINRLYGVVPHF